MKPNFCLKISFEALISTDTKTVQQMIKYVAAYSLKMKCEYQLSYENTKNEWPMCVKMFFCPIS